MKSTSSTERSREEQGAHNNRSIELRVKFGIRTSNSQTPDGSNAHVGSQSDSPSVPPTVSKSHMAMAHSRSHCISVRVAAKYGKSCAV